MPEMRPLLSDNTPLPAVLNVAAEAGPSANPGFIPDEYLSFYQWANALHNNLSGAAYFESSSLPKSSFDRNGLLGGEYEKAIYQILTHYWKMLPGDLERLQARASWRLRDGEVEILCQARRPEEGLVYQFDTVSFEILWGTSDGRGDVNAPAFDDPSIFGHAPDPPNVDESFGGSGGNTSDLVTLPALRAQLGIANTPIQRRGNVVRALVANYGNVYFGDERAQGSGGT